MIDMNKFNKNPDMDFIFKAAIAIWAIIIILVLFLSLGNNEAPLLASDNNDIDMVYKNSIEYQLEKLNTEIEGVAVTSQLEPAPFYSLSDYERWLVESIVVGESGIEPYWGKVAVASCILNACLLEDKRPEEIQTMYGYVGWKPIEEFESDCMAAYGNTNLSDEVREAVSQVFDDGEVLNNEILWFCSSYSRWHESQRFVVEISNHRFFAPWG